MRAAAKEKGPSRTRKSSLTLAAFRPWGNWARYRRARNHARVYMRQNPDDDLAVKPPPFETG